MELKETFVSRQEIFHGRIVDLRVDTVRLPNGHLTTREVIPAASPSSPSTRTTTC